MYEIGLISIGALAIILLAFCFFAYLARGHRLDLTQIRAVNVWEENDRRSALGPRTVWPKDRDVKLPEPPDETPAQSAVSDMMRAGMQHGHATVRERGEDE